MELILILLFALILDLAFGEPPSAFHPVAGMGKFISFLERFAPQSSMTQLIYGIGMVLLSLGIFVLPIYFLLFYLGKISLIAYIAFGTLLLKLTFSVKGLRQAALKFKETLMNGELEKARFELRSLVGRNTENLDEGLLASAAVESVAENTSDSLVAPLFYFLIFGLPGAIAYRVVNTCDAMLGYHGKYEHLGKFAARLDDVLNFIPSRLTALLMLPASFLSGGKVGSTWQTMLRYHARTQSLNAGWPMAAAAGALEVKLEKMGCYQLGRGNNPLSPQKIDFAVKLMERVVLIWVLICLAFEVVRFAA